MGIRNALKDILYYHQIIFHLSMFTLILIGAVAAASTSYPTRSEESIDSLEMETPLTVQRPAIPFCHDSKEERSVGRRLLYITTLDGRLSALDITKSGNLRWSIETGPGPLISSSIHRLELTNNGQFVRMIPSLSGGIYKFDGESIDPLPITTENLLSSSAKFSDDLVISGGKETRTYGVSVRTGKLLYECSMHGCVNSTEDLNGKAVQSVDDHKMNENESRTDYIVGHDPLLDDVVVVRRVTQTVRAVESRTGVERWNFSVGQHEVDLLPAVECHQRKYSDLDLAVFDVEIKVVVPEGIVCAFSKTDPHIMLWKYKFNHPIVSAWIINESEQLVPLDLFSTSRWLWTQEQQFMYDEYPTTVSPSIYLGMYEKQLYIQESTKLRKEIFDQAQLYPQLSEEGDDALPLPKIPWRPIAANSNSLMIISDGKLIESNTILGGTVVPGSNEVNENGIGKELVPYNDDHYALAAQSVLNASEYVNGNGFFFYMDDSWHAKAKDPVCEKESTTTNKKQNVPAIEPGTVTPTEEDEGSPIGPSANESSIAHNNTITDDLGFSLDDIDAPVKVVILSLWFWWKEIVVIAFTSAVLLNMFLGQRQRTEREIVVIERHVPVATAIEATEASTQALLGPVFHNGQKHNGNRLSLANLTPQRSTSESTNNSFEQYTSRFQTDFDLLQCLGRGGFGVVFEAKNKLDENKYAVKRITLPNKESSRQRVLREARTLASCEHQNIVRYFHSWVETPPTGWQEEEDRKLLAHEMSTSIQIETPDGSTLPSLADSLAKYSDAQLKKYQLDKKNQLLSWVSNATSTACSYDQMPGSRGLNGIREHADEHSYDDSSIVFRSESQSAELYAKDDFNYEGDGDRDRDEAGTANVDRSRPVSIDIHSSSFDLKNINYTQLSDSFKIEFVRPTNGGIDNNNDDNDDSDDDPVKRKQQLALALPHNNNANTSAIVSPPKTGKVFLYIQMQLCRKESLRDWLRDNTTEARKQHIAHIFHQIVDAVDYVHYKGLIHRDLKPSNIFFSQDGQVKIGDFGLVTDMSDIPNLVTQCGDQTGLPSCSRHTQQVGTHLYMSPEQLRGKHYDYKVDIYSLGLIFFELHVYFGTEMERIKTLRDLRDGIYPAAFLTTYPAEYALLQQMLATDSTQRPQTKELKQQLNNILRLPDHVEDGRSEAAAMAAATRRLSHSRTFSSSE